MDDRHRGERAADGDAWREPVTMLAAIGAYAGLSTLGALAPHLVPVPLLRRFAGGVLASTFVQPQDAVPSPRTSPRLDRGR
ncbi:MAG TPA: hypothetical protein VME40_10365 [Caulobacteraceae bacterium]|nr:hypothetical protein [Caulobacteraceae bacterium]